MISVIAEHSIDLDLLPECGEILDIGCRGFKFASELEELGHLVTAVDIDLLPEPFYYRCAISDFDGMCGVLKTDDPQATKISKSGVGIECYTVKSFSEKMEIEMWDCIKMDVEGAEYEIIMSMEKPMAKQLSIEFHLHTGVYGLHEMSLMENKLKSLGYAMIQHNYEARHCAGFNFWDSLFILK